MKKRLFISTLTLLMISLLPKWNILAQDSNNEKQAISPEFRGQFSEAMKGYFELESAIFDGDIKNASEKAVLLEKAFTAIKSEPLSESQQTQWQKQLLALGQASTGLAVQKEIDTQRSAFLAISNVLIKMTKDFGPLNYDTFLMHCPMAVESGGHWLSQSKDIANPFFGKSMATCGTLVETFAKTTDQK